MRDTYAGMDFEWVKGKFEKGITGLVKNGVDRRKLFA